MPIADEFDWLYKAVSYQQSPDVHRDQQPVKI